MIRPIYAVIASGLLGLYGAASVLGWEAGGYSRETAAQASARQQAGGHRAHSSGSWLGSSFRGGK